MLTLHECLWQHCSLDSDDLGGVPLLVFHGNALAMPLQVYSFGEGSFGALSEDFRGSFGGSSKCCNRPNTRQRQISPPCLESAGLPCTEKHIHMQSPVHKAPRPV